MTKTLLITLFAFMATNFCMAAEQSAALPVIPGEQVALYGMDTPAGSGRHLSPPKTTVCKVTNLKDKGNGSLRYCVHAIDGPKMIVFEVSGNIELTRPITLGHRYRHNKCSKGNYTTIAGQTAPSPGITLKNYGLRIERNCHDILVQHLRIRPGDTSFYDRGCDAKPRNKSCTKPAIADPMVLVGKYRKTRPAWTPPYNIVIDHNSFSWGGDMNFQSGGNNITVSNNISAEALHNPLHPKGPHSKGMAFLGHLGTGEGMRHYSQYVMCHKNLIAHCRDRNPLVAGGRVVIANNVMYDTGSKASIIMDDHSRDTPYGKVSIVGNFQIDTDIQKAPVYLLFGPDPKPETKVYLGKDNYLRGKVQVDPWNTSHRVVRKCVNWGKCNKPFPKRVIAATPQEAVWPEGYNTLPIDDVLDHVLDNVGARPADRDAVDSRIIKEVRAASPKSKLIRSQDEVGGWPDLEKNHRKLTVPANPHAVMASGYTRLEEWLHGYSRLVERQLKKTKY